MLCYAWGSQYTHANWMCECACVCVPAEKTHDVKYEIWNHMHVFLYKTCPKGTTKPKSSQAEAEAERERREDSG